MVKAVVLLDNLKNGASFAHHAISSRNPLPVLLNFLIETKDGNMFISATDLEVGIKVRIPAKVEREGETTVSAKTFMDLVASINVDKIELEEKAGVLELRGANVRTSFPTIPATEFPKMYEEKGNKLVDFSKEELFKSMGRVVFAASVDTGRPALSGVLIKKEEKDKGVILVATDGYRLSLEQGSSVGKIGNQDISLLIPARVIKEILAFKDQESKIELFTFEKSNQVVFENQDTTLVGRLIEAEYPNYQKIIPEDYSVKATFSREEALSAVRTCSVFAREAANIVKMSILKDRIRFSASSSSVGENEVEVEAKIEGEENEIAFNAKYLLDLFGNIDAETIVFQMTGPLNPGVFRIEGNDSYLHLIMPIRVQG